ncbi:MAG: hypothetical protein GY801_36800 [bacterium]|nr:hypothetical protein [bacterium]
MFLHSGVMDCRLDREKSVMAYDPNQEQVVLVLLPSHCQNRIDDGEKTVNETLREKALNILETHNPEPLRQEVKEELDKIWDDANKF